MIAIEWSTQHKNNREKKIMSFSLFDNDDNADARGKNYRKKMKRKKIGKHWK